MTVLLRKANRDLVGGSTISYHVISSVLLTFSKPYFTLMLAHHFDEGGLYGPSFQKYLYTIYSAYKEPA